MLGVAFQRFGFTFYGIILYIVMGKSVILLGLYTKERSAIWFWISNRCSRPASAAVH